MYKDKKDATIKAMILKTFEHFPLHIYIYIYNYGTRIRYSQSYDTIYLTRAPIRSRAMKKKEEEENNSINHE